MSDRDDDDNSSVQKLPVEFVQSIIHRMKNVHKSSPPVGRPKKIFYFLLISFTVSVNCSLSGDVSIQVKLDHL